MELYIDDRARSSASRTLVRIGESLDYAKTLWGPELELSGLTKQHLAELWAHLRDPSTSRYGKQRSLDTCRKHVEEVQRWWAWAARDERFEKDSPLPRTIDLPRDPLKLPTAPTWAECDRMIGALSVEWQRRAAVLARFTGARSHELVSLDWRYVDLDQGQIRWRHAITKGGYGGRVVPIPPPLARELAGWGKRDGLVFGGSAASEAHMRDDFSRAWKRACVPEDRWFRQPTHAFRKAIETELRARGVPHEILNVYVGHKDTSVAGRHYADPRWAWAPMVAAVELIAPIDLTPRALEVVS